MDIPRCSGARNALKRLPTDLVFVQPYCRIGNVVEARIAYLKELCGIGVLREVKAGREKVFIHPNLLALLTAENHAVPEAASAP